jgi:hypothetical protein
MTFDILMPELNARPKNTKDGVISILIQEWPLTLRQIFYSIKKQFHYSSTYQSVYKAVKELKQKDVLKEKDKKYEINTEWIKKVQSFTDIVETNYYAKEKLQNFSGVKESKSGEDLIILNFETIFDAEKYLYYFMKTELFKKRNEKICFQLNNLWQPTCYLRAEYNYYKRLLEKNHKVYFLYSGNSEIEKKAAKFYSAIGVKLKKKNHEFSNETISFLDFFIQIFVSDKLKKEIKIALNLKDNLKLLKTLGTKSNIRIIINKDKGLAEEFRKNF